MFKIACFKLKYVLGVYLSSIFCAVESQRHFISTIKNQLTKYLKKKRLKIHVIVLHVLNYQNRKKGTKYGILQIFISFVLNNSRGCIPLNHFDQQLCQYDTN